VLVRLPRFYKGISQGKGLFSEEVLAHRWRIPHKGALLKVNPSGRNYNPKKENPL